MTRTLRQSAERIRKRLGIFCMTSEKDNILMWSHYANDHTGFCLGFKTRNAEGEPVLGQVPLPVDYASNRPCLNLIEKLDPKELSHALLTKAEDWKRESEWRIVDHKTGPGIHQFPADALCEVILGCRITPGNRNRVMRWCRERDPQPAVFWAEEKDREFGLDIVPIS